MKIARYKKVQRFLTFYNNFFEFRQPYQVLIDGTFCFTAGKEQINIKEQLPKYIGSEIKLLTTKCIAIEAEKIAKKILGASNILKQFGIHKCKHNTPVTGAECILSMIGKKNKSHYIVATQDRSLQESLRRIPGVPLIYLHKKTPTLEKPSDASSNLAQDKKESCTVTEMQDNVIRELKEKFGLPTREPVEIVKKKKKKRGPNPLSCLKKKKKSNDNKPKKNLDGKVKKRIRVKIPSHVKRIKSENS